MTFTYHRSVAPMMWILVAIATVETLVVHLLVVLWSPWVAAVLSVVSVVAIVWLIALIRSFAKLPVKIVDCRLIWRVGTLRQASVSLEDIAGLKPDWTAADVKRRDVLNCAMIAYPNTFVVLREPVRVGRRAVSALAHRLDDPMSFATVIASLDPDDR